MIDLLTTNGAEQINYFSDYVTHLICGKNPNANDIEDARELYEVPIMEPLWVKACLYRKKLVSKTGFEISKNSLFNNCTFLFSQLSSQDQLTLWSVVRYHGGKIGSQLASVNYLVLGDCVGALYESVTKCKLRFCRVGFSKLKYPN